MQLYSDSLMVFFSFPGQIICFLCIISLLSCMSLLLVLVLQVVCLQKKLCRHMDLSRLLGKALFSFTHYFIIK